MSPKSPSVKPVNPERFFLEKTLQRREIIIRTKRSTAKNPSIVIIASESFEISLFIMDETESLLMTYGFIKEDSDMESLSETVLLILPYINVRSSVFEERSAAASSHKIQAKIIETNPLKKLATERIKPLRMVKKIVAAKIKMTIRSITISSSPLLFMAVYLCG